MLTPLGSTTSSSSSPPSTSSPSWHGTQRPSLWVVHKISSFSFLWRGRWCLFFLWWGWCVVFLCSLCSCCWGWCLFFLCSCCWCFCLCCSLGRSLVFLWGGRWLGWWVSLGLLLLWGWWLGRGHPHGLWIGAEVLNFIGLVRLPPRLPLVQLLIRFAFGGEHLATGHGLRPVFLFFLLLLPLLAGAPLIVGDDDGHLVLRGPPGPCWLDFGFIHNHRRDRSGAVDDPPRLVAVFVGPISALPELISCLLVRVGSALLLWGVPQ